MTKVYVSVNKGAVPVSSGFVSHNTLPVLAKLALLLNVYIALFAVQETMISMFEGVIEREV